LKTLLIIELFIFLIYFQLIIYVIELLKLELKNKAFTIELL